MKISGLKIDFGYGGRAIVEIWANLHTQSDVDDLIAWLQMAKGNMRQWEKIHARSSQASEAAASKDETAKPGKVQGEPQVA